MTYMQEAYWLIVMGISTRLELQQKEKVFSAWCFSSNIVREIIYNPVQSYVKTHAFQHWCSYFKRNSFRTDTLQDKLLHL